MKKTFESILLELHYLPNIYYFSKLLQYPTCYIEQHEHYTKGSFRNRTMIYGANGSLRLSIPLSKGKNEQQDIREVRIAKNTLWRSQHWTAIRSAYGNSPYFEFYADQLHVPYQGNHDFLFDFNLELLHTLIKLLALEIEPLFTQEYLKTPSDNCLDFRNIIHPKTYLNTPDSSFQPSPYAQVFQEKSGFLPNLSVIDLLFCAGPASSSLLESSIKI